MFEKYNNLSDEQLVDKVRDINNKLNCAYGTNVGQSYIDLLLNALSYISNIQENRLYMKEFNGNSGVLYDSMEDDQSAINRESESKEETKVKKFTQHKFTKVYREDED